MLDRLSYHYHTIGPTIHFHLDSGYIHTHADQVSFVEETLKSNPGLYRFANYHNPIYPGCANQNPESNKMRVVAEGIDNWVPLFDKWNFTTALEHHTHFRKMTYRLRNSTRDVAGTRYIGDGSWGVLN